MEINEGTAQAIFLHEKYTCPMEPHATKGFKGKMINKKSVPELRDAMTFGRSTRQWEQSDSNHKTFKWAKHMDAEQQPAPGSDESEESEISGVRPRPITIAGVDYPLSMAAHHLIPGKASLPVSELAAYLWKSEGKIEADVGYDCDGSENGVWLPTHQIMSKALGKAQTIVIHDEDEPSPTVGMSWAQLSALAKATEGDAETYNQLFLPRYTQQAMKLAKAQFHDGHPDYDAYVTKKLDEIATVIEDKISLCQKCRSQTKFPPPYALVYRLNRLAGTLRGLVTGPPRRSWLTVYTSDFARYYRRTPLATAGPNMLIDVQDGP